MRAADRRGLGSGLVAIVLLVVYGAPAFWLIVTSLKGDHQVIDAGTLIFTPSLSAYAAAFDEGVVRAMWTSTQIAVSTTVLVLVLGLPAAYWLARTRSRVVSAILFALIVLQMVPQTSAVIPLFKVLGSWSLTGHVSGVVLAISAIVLPFAILLMRPFFAAVPLELEEAASVDGASAFVVFTRVVLPLVKNGIVTVGVLVFVISWGEFIYAINFLFDSSTYPVSAVIARQVSFFSSNWSVLMALSVLTAIPIVVIFVAAQRRLAEGLSLGAVKG